MFQLRTHYPRIKLLPSFQPPIIGKPTKLYKLHNGAQFQRAHMSLLIPTIRQILAHPPAFNSEGSARGHIKALRSFKNVGFMDLSDGSIHQSLSVIFNDPQSVFSDNKYKVGQSIEVTGTWVESQGVQDFELSYDASDPAHKIAVLGDVSEGYPIQKKLLTLQFLRGVPTLRHRTSLLASLLRFRSNVERIMGDFFRQNDLVKVTPPLITSSDCEGAGEQFQIRPAGEQTNPETHFFGKETYMTVSTQLHLEVLALSLNRAWTLTPCFRAEDSNTNRHLSEFWMIEAELCYVNKVSQLTAFVEEMLRELVNNLKRDDVVLSVGSRNDILKARLAQSETTKIHTVWTQILSDNPWPSITYTEAIALLNRVKYKGRLKNCLQWGASILTEDEKWLAGTHYKSPVFITDYPQAQKPFYMLKNPDNPETPGTTVACFDLIVPAIGELVGGSLREHDYQELVSEMETRNMQVDTMRWYLSTRANGSVPHGGFGMGFERLLAYLAAVENIRDVSAFPRAPDVFPC